MYAAYHSGQFSSASPVRFSCSPWAAAARRSAPSRSAPDLAGALRRAAAAHGEHEKRTGEEDADWPDWYARYMVAEEAGTELPT